MNCAVPGCDGTAVAYPVVQVAILANAQCQGRPRIVSGYQPFRVQRPLCEHHKQLNLEICLADAVIEDIKTQVAEHFAVRALEHWQLAWEQIPEAA